MINFNQFNAAYKSNLESMLDFSSKAFEGVEKFSALNLQVAKSTFGEAIENTKKILSARDSQDFIAIQAGLVQPLAQKSMSYSRYLYEIAANVQSELNKVTEKNFTSSSKTVETSIEGLSRDSQSVAESAATMVRTAVGTAYDSVQKATKQAVDFVEAGMPSISAPIAAAKK